MMKYSYWLIYLFVCFIWACGGKSKKGNDNFSLNNIDDIKTRQYAIEGRVLYEKHCSNCHKTNGEGLGKLIPPLKNSDYMLEDVGRTLGLIKNGISGEIMVNGTEYNQPMPANPQLTNLEIAEIATYIYTVFGQKEMLIDANMVNQHFKK